MTPTSVLRRSLPAEEKVIVRSWRLRVRPLVANRLVLAGGIIAFLLVFGAIFADSLAPHDPLAMEMTNALSGPSLQHWFGTDRFGRDILSRTMHGSRISLWVGLLSVVISVAVGTLLGLISGYFGCHARAGFNKRPAGYCRRLFSFIVQNRTRLDAQ